MDSIGETLRTARHNKKASLEDVCRATKIKIDILEKLEADDFNALSAPMYTKGFIKIYADFLGLESAVIVDAYLKSQGGLRRQGLHVETEAKIRAQRKHELQLPIGSVVRVVAAVSVTVMVIMAGRYYWTRRHQVAAPASKPAALPAADFEAYYRPKTKPAPELLELPSK